MFIILPKMLLYKYIPLQGDSNAPANPPNAAHMHNAYATPTARPETPVI